MAHISLIGISDLLQAVVFGLELCNSLLSTVKVFKQRDGKTWLLPRNSAYEPIDGDYAKVLGKVVAVIRSVQ